MEKLDTKEAVVSLDKSVFAAVLPFLALPRTKCFLITGGIAGHQITIVKKAYRNLSIVPKASILPIEENMPQTARWSTSYGRLYR